MNPGNTWLALDTGAGATQSNMAFDEALLESVARFERPVLRFYGWTEPAASFGYFQKFAEVSNWTRLRPLVRRPTGGGLVSHDSDWTYSLAFPPEHWWYALDARESYHRVHEWIRDALLLLGVTSQLSPVRRQEEPGQCFVGAEQFDVLWHGKKIAGAAQRRNRHGLLIQGSVQPPPVRLKRASWQEAMRETGRVRHGIEWRKFSPDAEFDVRVSDLIRCKYSLPEHNQRR